MSNAHRSIMLVAAVLSITAAGVAQGSKPDSSEPSATGRVRGTVTFLFNQYQGNKPDVGSIVVLTPGLLSIPEIATVVMIPTLLSVDGKSYEVTAHTMVDGSGDFDLPDVPAGQYTLVIESKMTRGGFHYETITTDRKGRPLKKPKRIRRFNQRDVDGKIVAMPVAVEAGKTSDESWDFGATYLMPSQP